jgi:hypothetical protein
MTVGAQEATFSFPIAPPQKAIPHNYPYGLSPSIELERISGGRTLDDYSKSPTPPAAGQTRSSSPISAVDQKQTLWNPYMNRFRVLGCCLTGFANGVNDSAPGPLLPSIET